MLFHLLSLWERAALLASQAVFNLCVPLRPRVYKLSKLIPVDDWEFTLHSDGHKSCSP